MNTIELVVGGQTYAITCETGEEEHVRNLGATIDEKFVEMGPRYTQNLLFAALQLADELHEARKATASVESDKRKLQDGFDAYRAEKAQQLRDADTLKGQGDVMMARIAELEQELDRMQSAQQSAAEHANDVRQELAALRGKETDREALENRHLAQIANLTKELAQAKAAPTAAQEPERRSASDPDLAPALERFALLLEETAEKLEERRGYS